jgi:hypothetical protein
VSPSLMSRRVLPGIEMSSACILSYQMRGVRDPVCIGFYVLK